ncbi:MAG: DNA repair protein RadA, partial [Muribaculaceae bacterium]|nr:DNA repair protein RadA [Muribaculaceae bacterium]
MASKTKTVYFCSSCGHESPKWLGKCPGCGEWNTFVEERVAAKTPKERRRGGLVASTRPIPLSKIESLDEPRIALPSKELNRVLGGGLVAGSLKLIGGETGICKSTLL